MTIETILTHPGGAHKDEFLACCVLLATAPATIVRRDPTKEDLTNPNTCVVDTGQAHSPELNNFDHHQFPRDHPPTCSLSLVLQHLGLYEDARQFCEWLEPAEWFDCRGAKDTAFKLGVKSEVLNQLNSPIDITLLQRFALCKMVERGNPIWEVMRMIGEDLLNYLKSLRARLDFIGQHAELWDLGISGQAFKVLFMPRTDPLPEKPSMGIPRYIKALKTADQVVGMVYPDRRGSGYGVSRYEDDIRLDFTKIEMEPDVHFAHARGFIAKTTATDSSRLRELVKAAWVL
ncbi:MAG TPA: hypothetical protein EYQ50_12115 [Verrucomicrobiales bacterium]|nr:hypothetical protein [Verrucomicrobiales bacterium]